jgi:putative spermidine/putrescine transport system permease protein
MWTSWVASADLAGASSSRTRYEARGATTPRVLSRLTKQLIDWLPALPLIVLALALLIVPTMMVIVQSLRDDSGAWTLGAWVDTLGRHGDQRAIVTSLGLGVVCATVSILVGAPVAWFLARATTPARASWLSLLNVGANFSGIGLAFGFTASLGTYGSVTLLLQGAGIAFIPPSPASFLGLAIGYVYSNVPLFVLLTMPAMGVVQGDSMEAAAVLGASRLEFWHFIGLPVLAPFLAAGWLLIFTWSIGIYGLAYALAGNAATSQLRLMTLQIGVSLNSAASSQERAAVMATLLLLIATVSLVAYRLVVRKAVQWVD